MTVISNGVEFIDPRHTLLQLGLKDGMQVGDFGCGSGHYALTAAGIIGPSGRVYAVDVQEDLLKRLESDAVQRGFSTIEYIWGDIEKAGGTTLPDASLDAVILSNTCFQLESKKDALTEIKRVLKIGGKVLLVEWSGAHEGFGPNKELLFTQSTAEELFVAEGFKKVKGFSAGPHHYALVFVRA
jgi:ubiquinone/menaquinone biosynthesis C-methylase UbiE